MTCERGDPEANIYLTHIARVCIMALAVTGLSVLVVFAVGTGKPFNLFAKCDFVTEGGLAVPSKNVSIPNDAIKHSPLIQALISSAVKCSSLFMRDFWPAANGSARSSKTWV